jgi:NitT/TauT family transport system substrate-binding protein
MLSEANLNVEFFYTEGGGQTLQALTSGSVDVAMSNGLLATVSAFSKGVPIRVISAQMTGANEMFWYVKSESKIRGLKDANDQTTVAFSATGSSTNLVLLELLRQVGSKAKPTATGGLPGTLTAVMTGQIDIGWATPPFAPREQQEHKIRIIARAREATEMKNQTIRVNVAMVESLKAKRSAIARLMQVYAKAIDWAYTQFQGHRLFCRRSQCSARRRQTGGRRVLPERSLADRRNSRFGNDLARCPSVQIHTEAVDANGCRAAYRHRL